MLGSNTETLRRMLITKGKIGAGYVIFRESKRRTGRTVPTDARHCNLAELSAIVQMCGHFSEDFKGRITLQVDTENYPVARKCFTLMRKTFNIKTEVSVILSDMQERTNWSYHLLLEGRGTPCGKECVTFRQSVVKEPIFGAHFWRRDQ